MNIFVVVQENKEGSLLLCAEVDKVTAEKQMEYYKTFIPTQRIRLAEIELTNKRLQFKGVLVDSNELEHLLNCMDNQKFIHEQNEDTQKEWQEIIDKANRKMRQVWVDHAIK